MLQLYMGCLAFGILFALVSVVLGDIVSTALHGALDFLSADYLNPTVLASAVTGFGGAGLMLTRYSNLVPAVVLAAALATAFAVGAAMHVFYVKPMRKSENSTGYSVKGLTGKIGEVIVPIPAHGFGEVLVRAGAFNTNQIAASFEQHAIQAGERIVVVEVRDGTLYVSRFENMDKGD